MPFGKACKLIINVLIDPCGSIDCYIDDTPVRLTVDIPGTENATRLEAAMSLAIKAAAWPDNANKPIPHEAMVASDKVFAVGGLLETKITLGWLFILGCSSFPSRITNLLHGRQQFKNDHAKARHLKRTWHVYWTNVTCGILDSRDLPLPKLTPLPSLPQYKPLHHHNKWHMHERFGINESDFGKSTQGKWHELTCIPHPQPHVLFRLMSSRARGIQWSRACMAFLDPGKHPILSHQQLTWIPCGHHHPPASWPPETETAHYWWPIAKQPKDGCKNQTSTRLAKTSFRPQSVQMPPTTTPNYSWM